jgi:hypothetical protein
MHSKTEGVPVNGSVVVVGIDYTNPLLLEEALKFNARPHQPIDRIELHYETDDANNIIFNVKQEAASLGSRMGGTPVRAKLLNLMRVSTANQIIVDFAGVHMISSSFADEVFGKLFSTLGPIEFSSKFRFAHTDPIVRNLIDKAIMQRAAVPLRE